MKLPYIELINLGPFIDPQNGESDQPLDVNLDDKNKLDKNHNSFNNNHVLAVLLPSSV